MIGGRAHGLLVRLRVSALTATILLTALVGTALAANNSVHLRVPQHARRGVQYSVGIHGFAAHRERLYIFLDFHSCGPNPAIEHQRANGDVWIVHGSFHEVSSHWTAKISGSDHACAYLQKLSEAENAPGGVLAHAFKRFHVAP